MIKRIQNIYSNNLLKSQRVLNDSFTKSINIIRIKKHFIDRFRVFIGNLTSNNNLFSCIYYRKYETTKYVYVHGKNEIKD